MAKQMTEAEIQAFLDNEDDEVLAEYESMGPGDREVCEYEDGDGEEQVKPE